MYIAVFIVLLDMIGFAIMLPILAYYALQLGATPGMATFCMALYVVGMFFATPIWGKLSDRFGRKPILVLSLAGAICGYVLLGFATEVWMVALSRLFSGLMAGNLSVAQAYVADVTTNQDRAKAMGMLGAAFGISFILGPALGGYLAGDSFADANLQLPAMVSAGLTLSALMVVVFFLKESLPDTAKSGGASPSARQMLTWIAGRQTLCLLLAAVAVYNLAAGFVESVFPIWADATNIAHGPKDLVPVLLAAGIAMVIVQGGLIGPLSRRFGERRLMRAGAVIFGISALLVSVAGSAASVPAVAGALMGQAIGAALVLTSMQSLTSKEAEAHSRGAVMGIYNALGTLGRALGTGLTGSVFAGVGVHAPYYVGAGLMALLLLLALTLRTPQLVDPVAAEVATGNS
ncbi:Tetracycline resistance protein, class B [Microbulbifer aggregans]|uniref:Tetracycline resistance protein, class B n=1 Tax=Microbulbifer aggregans TaxID=1769779 RepID=A0A1C9WAX5_9GAMM|nr:MFS transporter [Microbulbifer aggregans]AOS98293.1 Tetracycline resistance protein, class B [Microbulbifer aggregans]